MQWGQVHIRAQGQDRQAKHAVGSGTYTGTRAGLTGKACSGVRYIYGHKGRTDRQSMQWGQVHMWAHGQNRQAAGKHSVGTVTQTGTWAGQTGKAGSWDRHTGVHRGGTNRKRGSWERYKGGSN
jgi:hypothetical protein